MKIEHKEGLIWVEGLLPGTWTTYETKIDSLIGVCRQHLKLAYPAKGKISVQEIGELGIDHAAVSLVRLGKQRLPGTWLLRFHVWSGVPMSVLEAIAQFSCGTVPNRRRP